MGEFDGICSSFVRNMKRRGSTIKLYLVIPYFTQAVNTQKDYYEEMYDDIIRPVDLMGVHYKQAIQSRNKWMIDNAGYLVAYVDKEHGGAYQTLRYAKGQKGIHIVNLAKQKADIP